MTSIRNTIHTLGGCAACATALALAACSVTTAGPDGGPSDNGSSSSGGGSGGASSGGSSSGGGGDDGGPAGDDASDAGPSTDATVDSGPGPVPEGGPDPLPPPDAGCLQSISGTYVVRKDGLALFEGPPETAVIDGTSGTMNTPLASVQSVSQSLLAACALVNGGNVWCWQENANSGNTSGQLGNGTTSPSPVYHASEVLTAASTPLTNVVSLATGLVSNATCAITGDGKLWCWGDLGWIAHGGATLIASYAQPITTDGQTPLTGVIQASISYTNACALVSGSPVNSVYCWGYDLSKQLGQGDTTNRQYPGKVTGLTSPRKVAVGVGGDGYQGAYYGTVCVLDGDSVLCWGSNSAGSTGSSGGTDPVPSPTLVVTAAGPTLRGVLDLEAGGSQAQGEGSGFGVIRNDGTVWLWGGANGNKAYASSYGVTNVVALGWVNDPRYLTGGGTYFSGTTAVNVNCGAVSQ